MTRSLRVVEQYNKGLLRLSSRISSVKQELSKARTNPEKILSGLWELRFIRRTSDL